MDVASPCAKKVKRAVYQATLYRFFHMNYQEANIRFGMISLHLKNQILCSLHQGDSVINLKLIISAHSADV